MDEAQRKRIIGFQSIVEDALQDAVTEACIAVWGPECEATREDIREAYGDMEVGAYICHFLFHD